MNKNEKIGTAFRVVGDKLLVKLSIVPKIETRVYDEDGNEVGKIVDIIGSVRSPFGVVKAEKEKSYKLQGKVITIMTGKPKEEYKEN